jgi:phytoene synthase
VLLQRRDGEVLDEARATTRGAAHTFALACRLLPRRVRSDVYLLYLVFRTLDDLVDTGHPTAGARLASVEAWGGGGGARCREARLLADVATRHPLPRRALVDFCRGMRDDLDDVLIDTEDDLDRYCYRVAGTVGIVMASVLGTHGDADDQAAALGMAMQRTNILRDIDEDRANGRTYIPRETLARFGTIAPGRREDLLRDHIARADALYEVGMSGIPRLRSGRRAIAAAACMYREILRQIEREGYGARVGRAVVPRARKLLIAARRGVSPP